MNVEVFVGTGSSLDDSDTVWSVFVSRLHGTLADVRHELQEEQELHDRQFTFRRIKHTGAKVISMKVTTSGEAKTPVTALEHAKEIYVGLVFGE